MIKILTINLLESLRNDKLEISKVHLQNGADPNYVIPSEGVAPIHLAAGLGISATSLLIEYGGNPNIQSSEGSTPLHVAATWGDEACVKLLLQSGADPHLKDQDGFRPLDVAKVYGHEEVFLYLKYYSLLLLSEDDDVSEKFTRYSSGNASISSFERDELKCLENGDDDLDNPSDLLDGLTCCVNPDAFFTQTINQKLSHQLKQGNKVVLDVTSPDNPYIDYKTTFRDTNRDIDREKSSPNSRGVHSASFKPSYNNGNKESNIPRSQQQPEVPKYEKYSSHSLVEKPSNPNLVSTSYQLQGHDQSTKRSQLPEFQHNFKHNNTLQWVADHAKLPLPHRKDRSDLEDLDKTPTNVKTGHRSKGSAKYISTPKGLLHSVSDSHLCPNASLHCRNQLKQREKCTSSAFDARNLTPNLFSPYHSDTNKTITPYLSSPYHSDSNKTLTDTMSPACKFYSRREFVQTKSNIVPRRCQDDRHKLNYKIENGMGLQNSKSCENCTHTFSSEMSDTLYSSEDTLCQCCGDTYANMISECVPLCDESGHILNISDIERQNRYAYEKRLTDNKQHWLLTDPTGDGIKNHNCHCYNQGHNIHHQSPQILCVHYSNSFDQDMNRDRKQSKSVSYHHGNPSTKHLSAKQPLPANLNSSPESTNSIISASSSTTESVQFDLNAAHLSNLCPDESRSSGTLYHNPDSTLTASPELTAQNKPFSKSDKRRESDSSCDTFMTCEENISPGSMEKLRQTQATAPLSVENKQSHQPQMLKEKSFVDDLYTSDESFAERINAVTVRKKKSGSENFQHMGDLSDRLKSFKLDKVISPQKSTEAQSQSKSSQIHDPQRLSVASSVFDTAFCGGHRPSMDSVYSNISVKEYIYRDDERGITLIERHVPSECGNSTGRLSLDSVTSAKSIDSQKTEEYDWKTYVKREEVTEKGTEGTVEEDATQPFSQLSNEDIRNQLRNHGDDPGPILATTRQAYLIRLASLSQNPRLGLLREKRPGYSQELRDAMEGKFDMKGLEDFECKLIDLFNNSNGRRWREGMLKSSFNYLLLDPRVTKNLPLRSKNMGELDIFCTFIAAIFYVGKGKRSRPYTHLYEAITQMKKPKPNKSSKVQQIIDIWSEGHGVVSLHIFQNVIPVEAYTREACIIESIGLDKLTNKKKGDFYGVSSTWLLKVKRRMGVYFLKKALQIFLAEGERQISPPDIKSNQ